MLYYYILLWPLKVSASLASLTIVPVSSYCHYRMQVCFKMLRAGKSSRVEDFKCAISLSSNLL